MQIIEVLGNGPGMAPGARGFKPEMATTDEQQAAGIAKNSIGNARIFRFRRTYPKGA